MLQADSRMLGSNAFCQADLRRDNCAAEQDTRKLREAASLERHLQASMVRLWSILSYEQHQLSNPNPIPDRSSILCQLMPVHPDG